MILEITVAIIAGLIIGSFLNVCVYRLPRDLSVASPARSFCPGCEEMVAAVDNIPLLSFAMLRGRCRHCREQIPWRYPLVEFATAASFAVIVGTQGFSLEALKWCIFAAILVDLIATDYEVQILPDEFTIGGTVIGVAFAFFVPMNLDLLTLIIGPRLSSMWVSVIESVAGATLFTGMLWFIGWAFQKIRGKEGMGLGDVKMIMMIGAFLGMWVTLLTLLFASVAGAIFGLVHSRISGRNASTYELPFGSFLGIAALGLAIWTQVLK